jgi:hypothetical protein
METRLRIAKIRTTAQEIAYRQISVLEAEIDRLREENVRLRKESEPASSPPVMTRKRK